MAGLDLQSAPKLLVGRIGELEFPDLGRGRGKKALGDVDQVKELRAARLRLAVKPELRPRHMLAQIPQRRTNEGHQVVKVKDVEQKRLEVKVLLIPRLPQMRRARRRAGDGAGLVKTMRRDAGDQAVHGCLRLRLSRNQNCRVGAASIFARQSRGCRSFSPAI